MERILLVTKKSGNRERCRKLSLWNRSVDDISHLTIPWRFLWASRCLGIVHWWSLPGHRKRKKGLARKLRSPLERFSSCFLVVSSLVSSFPGVWKPTYDETSKPRSITTGRRRRRYDEPTHNQWKTIRLVVTGVFFLTVHSPWAYRSLAIDCQDLDNQRIEEIATRLSDFQDNPLLQALESGLVIDHQSITQEETTINQEPATGISPKRFSFY